MAYRGVVKNKGVLIESNNQEIRVSINCVVFGFLDGGLKMLIVNRGFESVLGLWSLPGDYIAFNENLTDTTTRVIENLTGSRNAFIQQLGVFGEPNRDPGGRVITIVYLALIRPEEIGETYLEEHRGAWVDLSKSETLIFDHSEMTELAKTRLVEKAKFEPWVFELLPEKFTLPDLQTLYESIYQKKLDTRNFRKKIQDSGLLIKQKEKDKTKSRRGAYYYMFNRKKYNESKSYDFNLTKYL